MLHSHYSTGTFSSRPPAVCFCRSCNTETFSVRPAAISSLGVTFVAPPSRRHYQCRQDAGATKLKLSSRTPAKVTHGTQVNKHPKHRQNHCKPAEQRIPYGTDIERRHRSASLRLLLSWNTTANLLGKPDPNSAVSVYTRTGRRFLLDSQS